MKVLRCDRCGRIQSKPSESIDGKSWWRWRAFVPDSDEDCLEEGVESYQDYDLCPVCDYGFEKFMGEKK